jgi:hypothetical protein
MVPGRAAAGIATTRTIMRTALLLRPLFVALLAMGAVAPIAGAQQAPYAGQRIRVTSGRLVTPLVGSFQAVERDSIVVLDEGMTAQRVAIALADVQSVETFGGFERGSTDNMLLWGAGGLVSGGILGYLVAVMFEAVTDDEYDTLASAGIGAGVGMLVGGYMGYRRVEERWTRVEMTRRVGIIGGGRRLGIAIAF